MVAKAIIYGAYGEELSTPETRRMSVVQRQRDAIRARFDAAQTTTENSRYWASADYLGPNSELLAGVRRTLRSRARYECSNNSYAAGIVRTLANDTIGTGPEVRITDPRVNAGDAATIEDLFWQWCLLVEMPAKLRQMRLAKARDGESFAMLFTNQARQAEIQLDFTPFEADYVSAGSFDSAIANLLDGVIVDDFGNVVAYRVLRDHPGDSGTMVGMADTIPARDVIHMLHTERPGQYRGVPEITSSLPLYAQLRRYTAAVLLASESAAIPSWMVETMQPPSDMVFGEAMDVLKAERGMGLVLPAGYKMSQLKAEHPTSTYAQFKREIVSEAARGPGVPYNVAAGDSSSYNYSSGRLDHRTYYKAIRIERSAWETRACDKLFRAWWTEARTLPNYLPEVARGTYPRHEWRWDGEEHVDPTKESDAAVTRVAYGFTSRIDEAARLGNDISVIDRKNAESFGMTVEEYRKRLGDKFFGAQVASKSVDSQPEQTGGNGVPNE